MSGADKVLEALTTRLRETDAAVAPKYANEVMREAAAYLTASPPVGTVGVDRPERVQAAFEVFKGKPDTGPNASALFEYIEQLESIARSRTALRALTVGTEPKTVLANTEDAE